MISLLLAITAALQATVNDRPAEISLMTAPRHYLERQYAASPAVGADYLFLTGEAVTLEVLFVNRTSQPLTILGAPGDLGRSMKMALTRRQQGTSEQMPFAFIQDGPLQLTDSTGQRDISWDGRIELVPKAIVSLPLRLERSTEALAGVYELHVTPVQARCEPSCVVYNYGGLFRFEIRTTTSKPEQLELLARQAYHAIYQSDFASADGAIAEMLRIHPRSVVAHQFNGPRRGRAKRLEGRRGKLRARVVARHERAGSATSAATRHGLGAACRASCGAHQSGAGGTAETRTP